MKWYFTITLQSAVFATVIKKHRSIESCCRRNHFMHRWIKQVCLAYYTTFSNYTKLLIKRCCVFLHSGSQMWWSRRKSVGSVKKWALSNGNVMKLDGSCTYSTRAEVLDSNKTMKRCNRIFWLISFNQWRMNCWCLAAVIVRSSVWAMTHDILKMKRILIRTNLCCYVIYQTTLLHIARRWGVRTGRRSHARQIWPYKLHSAVCSPFGPLVETQFVVIAQQCIYRYYYQRDMNKKKMWRR